MIIWGSRLYGKVDEVPGMFYVATNFGHLYYVPLIPLGSFVVTGEDGEGWQGAPIGLDGKSVGVAYLRGLCLLGSAVGAIMALTTLGKKTSGMPLGLIGLALVVLGVVGYMVSKRSASLNRASYPRACKLAAALGLSEEGRVLIDMSYGRIAPATAEARLGELGAQRAAEAEEQEQRARERREAREAREREREQDAGERRKDAGDAALRAKAPQPRKRRLGS